MSKKNKNKTTEEKQLDLFQQEYYHWLGQQAEKYKPGNSND